MQASVACTAVLLLHGSHSCPALPFLTRHAPNLPLAPHPAHPPKSRCAQRWPSAGCRCSRSFTLAPQPAIWRLSAPQTGRQQRSSSLPSCARCWWRCCRRGGASWTVLRRRPAARNQSRSAPRRRRRGPFSQQRCAHHRPSRGPSQMQRCSRRPADCCSSCSARCRVSGSGSGKRIRRLRLSRLMAAAAVAAGGQRQRRVRGGTGSLCELLTFG